MGTANQIVKLPVPICIPNDKSYCSGTPSTVKGDYYQLNKTADDWGDDDLLDSGLANWDGNHMWHYGSYWCGKEYHIPRGSLQSGGVQCTPVPGEYMCHKPIQPVGPNGCGDIYPSAGPCFWEDSVYQIAQQFGVGWKDLCALNQMKNCSVLQLSGSALKIPVRPSGFQQGPRNYMVL
jgi:hypothetical protein